MLRRLVLLIACLAAALAAEPASAASPAQTVGVFRGAVNTSGVAGWESWLGRPAWGQPLLRPAPPAARR
jgi:hypothetical protein